MAHDVIVVEDVIMENGRRFVHLMSNAEIKMRYPEDAQARATVEAGVHHLRVEMPLRGLVDFHCEGWKSPRRFVFWSLRQGERMSEIILQAATEHCHLFGSAPDYAFVRQLPTGIEEGTAVEFLGGEILLFSAEWMVISRAVAVGWNMSTC
jgi:hypothetical protein